MKFVKWCVVVSIFLSSVMFAQQSFSKEASKTPELVQEGKQKAWCPVCGMSLKKFYKTSHTAVTKEGKIVQYCSLRCLVLDNQERDTNLTNAKVIDAKSEKFILVHDAYYVVGSKVKGTMSKVSKIAFKKEVDAKEFMKKMGGEIVRFKEAYEMAKKSLQDDIAMTNAKREKMMYPMGKKIYSAKCDKRGIDASRFKRINELKVAVKESCKGLKEKQMQAVALYLWDVARFENGKQKKITVKADDKCPVCGMFVSKYPRWIAKITYNHDGHEHYYAFDGVKDMVKFFLEPLKYGAKKDFKVKNIQVTDYYTQLAVDGKKAFYVIGSDVLGPMGHELIPFKKQSDAKTFLKDHKGEKIVMLEEVTASMLCRLGGNKCE